MDTTATPPDRIFRLGQAFLASQALATADEVGLFPLLADGPLSRREIETALEFEHHHGVRDFLDVLAAHGLLERERQDGECQYGLTDLSATYLLPERDEYVGDYVQFTLAQDYESATGMRAALETGTAQNGLGDGERLFEDGNLYEDETATELFQDGMHSVSTNPADWLTERVDWDQFDTVCDLGAAKGTLVRAVAEASDCETVGFDLPPAREGFESYTADSEAADRIRFVAGDFFEDPLPDADAYVLGHVLNDWSDEEKRELLEIVHEELGDGTLFVYGIALSEPPTEDLLGLYTNLTMMLEFQEAHTKTVDGYESMLSSVGFESVDRRELPGAEMLLTAQR